MSNKQITAKSVFSAVALQDHFIRNLNLDDGKPKKAINYPLPIRKKDKVTRKSIAAEKNDTTNGNSFGRINRLSPAVASSSVSASPIWSSNFSSPSVLSSLEREEYVLNKREKPKKAQSLAEKYGIIKDSTGLYHRKLSEREWQILKRKAFLRSDITSCCPICKEAYMFHREQVLLSCSHTFHLRCIFSFEKFSDKMSCPLCRSGNYEKRVIFDGAFITSNRAATKIQAQWRTYKTRKAFLNNIKDIIPKNHLLKKKFFQSKFLDLSEKLVNNYDAHNANVEQLIAEIDNNLALNKSLMANLEHESTEDKWERIQELAVNRKIEDCPICLSKLGTLKRRVLLTCAHIFHESCLLAFEEFTVSTNVLCPVCRSVYMKRLIVA